MQAILYGIGVGPGEPELITVKAVRAIEKSDVILMPGKDVESCHAYQFALPVVPVLAEKELFFLPYPESMKKEALDGFHKEMAAKAAEFLKAGKSAAFLCVGDPTIYSTFSYLDKELRSLGFPVEIVSGIPSFCAAAARLGLFLADGSEEIHVIPGSSNLAESSRYSGTRIYMKSGKKLEELIRFLREESKIKNLEVSFVSNCGMENEEVGRNLDDLTVKQGYLTVVIVKEI